MVALGEVGDEGHGHAHVDAGPDGDGEHGQEEGPPGAGAGLVEVPFGYGFVRLQREEGEEKGSPDERGKQRADWPMGGLRAPSLWEGRQRCCHSPLFHPRPPTPRPCPERQAQLKRKKAKPQGCPGRQWSAEHQPLESWVSGTRMEGGDVTSWCLLLPGRHSNDSSIVCSHSRPLVLIA